MRRLSILALAIALLAAGFLGGRLLTLGQATRAEEDLKLRVSQLEAKLEEIAAQWVTQESLQALVLRLQALEEELRRQQEEGSRRAGDTEERLAGLGSQLAQLRSQVEALASQVKGVSQLESQLRAQADRLDAVEEVFRMAARATEDVRTEISALKDRVSQIAQTLEAVQGEGEGEGDEEARWAAQEDLLALVQRVESLEERQEEALAQLSQLAPVVEAEPSPAWQIGVVNLAQVYARFLGLDPRKLERALEEVGQAGDFDLLLRAEGSVQRDLVLYARPGSLIDVTEQVIALLEREAQAQESEEGQEESP